jgi:ribonucleotide reductase alpha subunit
MLFSLACDHPDIEEFCTVKKDYTKIQNANISVQCTNTFYEAVLKDEPWQLKFTIPAVKKGQKVYIDVHSTDLETLQDENGYYYIAKRNRKAEKIHRSIPASKLLDLIAQNMSEYAEPGIQNIDIAREYSNSDYVYDPKYGYDSRILSTNACCFAKCQDVFVETESGPKEIKEITSQDKIWIPHWNLFAKTDGYFNAGIDEVFEVELSNCTSLFVTKNHKLAKFGDTFEFTEVKDLKIGDCICCDEGDLADVVEIRFDGVQEVGCITVPEYGVFVANGVISGNSEQYLSRESLCVLSSENCEKFSTDPEEYEKEQAVIGESINRFLDNVNEYELRHKTYATPHQKLAIEALRRTGAGYTNIAAWLFKQNLEYGTPEGNEAVDKFTERYNYHLYRSSINLGKEKGSFGLFNRAKLEKSPFIQHMMKLGLKFTHLRNVTCSSIAPTGTLTLMFRKLCLSYGIEPAFGMYFWKRTRMGGKYEYYFNVPGVVREYFAQHGYPIPMQADSLKDTWDGQLGKPIAEFIDKYAPVIGVKFKRATEVKPLDKLDLMARVMTNVDSSISVTYMLPEGSDWQDVREFILEAYRRKVKSIAAFPDRKMYGIVTYEPFKDLAVRLTQEGVQIHSQNFTEDELRQLNIQTDRIQKTRAPKRPESLPADVYVFTSKKQEYFVVVSTLNGEPYECFAGDNIVSIDDEGVKRVIPKRLRQGIVTKMKRGQYQLVAEDFQVSNISEHIDDTEEALTRIVSTSLRHGTDTNFLLQQLEKSKGDLMGFSKCIARALKNYVKEGTKVTGQSCPQCNSENLVRSEGCVSCSCGYSKC